MNKKIGTRIYGEVTEQCKNSDLICSLLRNWDLPSESAYALVCSIILCCFKDWLVNIHCIWIILNPMYRYLCVIYSEYYVRTAWGAGWSPSISNPPDLLPATQWPPGQDLWESSWWSQEVHCGYKHCRDLSHRWSPFFLDSEKSVFRSIRCKL